MASRCANLSRQAPLPDGTKRSKTLMTLRGATLFDGEPRSAREDGNPASNVRFPAMRETSHVYLTAVEVAKLAELCDTGTGQAVSLRDRQRPGPVVAACQFRNGWFPSLNGGPWDVRPVNRRSYRRRVRGSGSKTGSGRWAGRSGPPNSAARRCACTTCGIPTLRWLGRRVPT